MTCRCCRSVPDLVVSLGRPRCLATIFTIFSSRRSPYLADNIHERYVSVFYHARKKKSISTAFGSPAGDPTTDFLLLPIPLLPPACQGLGLCRVNTRSSRVISPSCLLPNRRATTRESFPGAISGWTPAPFRLPPSRCLTHDGTRGSSDQKWERQRLVRPPSKRPSCPGTIVSLDLIEAGGWGGGWRHHMSLLE